MSLRSLRRRWELRGLHQRDDDVCFGEGPEAFVTRRQEIMKDEIIWFNLVYKSSDSNNQSSQYVHISSVEDISL